MNTSFAENLAVASTAQSIAQTPDLNIHRQDDTRCFSMADVRACGGDLESAIVLGQIRYWWPKKNAKHRGVKKSYADWKAELGMSKEKVQRINDVLMKCGMVEIYFDTWGHYKSKATFYVLTAKALAVKAQVGNSPMVSVAQVEKSPMVSKAQVGNPPITESTYKPTEKEETKAVDEKTPTLPVNSQTLSGKGKSTPKEPLKAFEVWKKNVKQHFPENYIEPQATDIKNLGPKMRRLYKSGVTDYLALLEWITTEEGFDHVRYEWNGIWDGDVNKLANPPMWPNLPFLLNERNLAVAVAIYRHVTKPAPTAEQQQQEQAAYEAEYQAHKAEQQAAIAKANAEIEALQAEKAKTTVPKKPSSIVQAVQQITTPAVEPVVLHVLTADDYEPCDEPPDDYVKATPTQKELLAAVAAQQAAKQAAKNKATMFQPKHVKTSATA
ncbi:hypothetical protein NE850_23070 [Paraburkholderia sp. USG1]|uniref:hypothetical protein n=1 Tax=Paraburkholderia sp. USG1 TaxID=2952268 RepID=UPI002865A401|nr:hypothetical protein [Paraburkholderia sp. USG1]MDR8399207.1 hypothetical protein [Paraburkholderia sp. USG1]